MRLPRRLASSLLATLLVCSTALAAVPEPPPAAGATKHIKFFADAAGRAAVERLLPEAEERLMRICSQLGACERMRTPIHIWISDDAQAFAEAFGHETPMAEWAAGVAFLEQNRIALRAHGTALFSLKETFDHELSHLIVHSFGELSRVPRWLSEGLAIWQSGEDVIGRLDAAHRAALTGNLLSLDELTDRFPNKGSRVALSYAMSALFVRHLIDSVGLDVMRASLNDMSEGQPWQSAFETRGDLSVTESFEDWVGSLEDSTSVLMLFRDGTLFWILMTVLFTIVAMIVVRERKSQLEDLGDRDDAEEAFDELQAQRDAGLPPTLH